MPNYVQGLKEKISTLEIVVEVYDDIIEQIIDAAKHDDKEKIKMLEEHYENFKRSVK